MKIESLVSNVTALRSPDRADGTFDFGGDLGWTLFWPIQAVFVVREPLYDVKTPS